MDGKEIIKKVFPETHWSVIPPGHFKWVLADAIDSALAAAKAEERERCAKVLSNYIPHTFNDAEASLLVSLSNKIRARVE